MLDKHPVSRCFFLILVAFLVTFPTLAQQKQLTEKDYGKWESLRRGAELSPDGNWLAVPISRVDGSSFLEVRSTSGEFSPITLEEGNNPAFSADSQWLAYSIGHSEAEREELRKAKKPVRNQLGLLELSSGQTREVPDIDSFAFSDNGLFLAALQYRPDAPGRDRSRPGAPLLLLRLGRDSTITLGNVSEFAWQDEGTLLAVTIQVENGQGDGVQLFDAASGSLRVLDSSEDEYQGLRWRKDADDLAYFRQQESKEHYEDNYRLTVWRGIAGSGSRYDLDSATQNAFPSNHRIVAAAGLDWDESGRRIFLTIQEWTRKEDADAKGEESRAVGRGARARGGRQATGGDRDGEAAADTPANGSDQDVSRSDVQVWHTHDERIFPMQDLQKNRDRNRGVLAAWEPASHDFRVLESDPMNPTLVTQNGNLVVERDENPYAFENQFDRPRSDVYAIDPASGGRKKAFEGVWYFRGASPEGRFLLAFQDHDFWAYDVSSGQRRNLTGDIASEFVDEEYDTPVRKEKPPWGVGGWTKGDEAVLLYDRYDVWWVPLSEGKPQKLTSGKDEQRVFRILDLEPDDGFGRGRTESRDPLDPNSPLYFSVEGEWTKKSGFAQLTPEGRVNSESARILLLEDASLGRLMRAKEAPVLAFVRQRFDDSPDYFVGDQQLSNPRQITHTNPFQSEYEWGRAELIDYESEWGKKLQGALYYPAGYQAGRRYPMIVYVYERRSQGIHSYQVPSERSPYNAAVFTTQGYFVLEPDIVYKDRDPGISAVQCVRPAVKAVLEKGAVDPKRVGLVGHSWGGYEASFIPTQTDIFAASIAGSPLTNFFSMFGTIHWNQGLPESSHFETGQARMGVPYWEDMEAYVRNSPVMHLQTLNTPMLLFCGDKDGTVDWHQGIELYNYARRAGKFLVMLVYPGENHSAREKKNQIDYHHRILQWFGHFLKGEPAPEWITNGVSALERERKLKDSEGKGGEG